MFQWPCGSGTITGPENATPNQHGGKDGWIKASTCCCRRRKWSYYQDSVASPGVRLVLFWLRVNTCSTCNCLSLCSVHLYQVSVQLSADQWDSYFIVILVLLHLLISQDIYVMTLLSSTVLWSSLPQPWPWPPSHHITHHHHHHHCHHHHHHHHYHITSPSPITITIIIIIIINNNNNNNIRLFKNYTRLLTLDRGHSISLSKVLEKRGDIYIQSKTIISCLFVCLFVF